jgi:Rrf2 family protein
MFSQTTEYALRVVVYLASLVDRPATIAQIAAATQAPPGYLAKVLRHLAIAQLVRSQRGLHGGSVLARPAGSITVLDVVQAVDPIHRISSCPLNLKSHEVDLCPLHRRLDHAITLVQDAFKRSPIAELVPPRGGGEPFQDSRPAPSRRARKRRRREPSSSRRTELD